MMYSMLELAGKDRVQYLPRMFYHYTRKNEFLSDCHHFNQKWDNGKMRDKQPLAPLSHLGGHVQISSIKSSFSEKELAQRKYDYLQYCNLEGSENV